jgi:hypothetical protein
MNEEIDKGKIQVGKNLTYMSVSRSMPLIADRYGEHMSKKNFFNILDYTIWYKAPHNLMAHAKYWFR